MIYYLNSKRNHSKRNQSLSVVLKQPKIAAILVLAFSLLLAIRLFLLIDKYAVNILFWDQWDFYDAFFLGKTFWEVFSWQHGPPRLGIGFLFTKTLAEWSSWNTRTEAFVIGGIVSLAMIFALALRVVLFGRSSWADVAIPLIFLTPAQYEIFIGTPNASHGAFPLLLVILYCFSWMIPYIVLRYIIVLCLNFLLIYTGFGIFIGLITPIILILHSFLAYSTKKSWTFITTFVALFIALLSGGTFFLDYSYSSAAGCLGGPSSNFWQYPQFIFLAFSFFLGARGIGPKELMLGIMTILAIIYVLFYHITQVSFEFRQNKNQSLVIVILILFSILFIINTTAGRICLGLPAAQTSRYIPYLVPAFLGIFMHLLTVSNVKIRIALFAAMVLLLLSASFPLRPVDIQSMQWFSNGKRHWKTYYLQNENIVEADNITGFKIYPNPELTHLKEKLDYLKKKRLNLYLGHTAE